MKDLRIGKRLGSLTHHADVAGIREQSVSPFSRDFLHNTKLHKMIQCTRDRGNGELQIFGCCPNTHERLPLHEFLDTQC